jgi:hypothetical protein
MNPLLVLGVTGPLGFAAGTVLASFRAQNPGWAGEVAILHDGLPASDAAALGRLGLPMRLVPFGRADVAARLAAAGLDGSTALDGLGRWGWMTLAKFEMLDWLDRHPACVWLDADVLVQGPVAPLWDAGPLAWRPLPDGALGRRAAVLDALAPVPRPAGVPLPNGGVVVAGAGLRAMGLGAAALWAQAARLILHTKAGSVDELAFYLMACQHGVPVTALDTGLNHPADQPGATRAPIVHAIGPDKFWNAAALRHGYPGWQAAHDRWVAAGGTPAPAPDRLLDVHPADPAEVITAARNRAFWQTLWPDLGPALPRGLWPDLRTERAFLRLHLTGASRALWIDLARAASPRRLGVGIGVERRRLDDPDLPARIDAALPHPRPPRHDGRRLTEWRAEVPLDAVPETVQGMRDALLTALTG